MKKAMLSVVLFGGAWAQSFVLTVPGSSEDYACSVVPTEDDGFLVAGYTASFGVGNYDAFLLRFGPGGDLDWARTVGGSGADQVYSVARDHQGHLAVAGQTNSFGAAQTDALVSCFDSPGGHLWTRILGGGGIDYAYSGAALSGGGYVFVGSTNSFGAGGYDEIVVRVSSSGDVVWALTVGGSNNEYGYAVAETPGGHIVVAGATYSFGAGGADIMVSEFDANGAHRWTKVIGGPGNDQAYSVSVLGSGDILVVGSSYSFGPGDDDLLFSCLDGSGRHLWTRAVGRSYGDRALSALPLIFAGYTDASSGNRDILLCSYDTAGGFVRTWVMGGGDEDMAAGLAALPGGYVLVGHSRSFGAGDYDILVARFDPDLSTCEGDTVPMSVQAPAPSVESALPTVSPVSPDISSVNPMIQEPQPALDTLCYTGVNESPVSPEISLRIRGTRLLLCLPGTRICKLSIYDVGGRLVAVPVDGRLGPGEHSLRIDLTRGIYLVEFAAGREHLRARMTIP